MQTLNTYSNLLIYLIFHDQQYVHIIVVVVAVVVIIIMIIITITYMATTPCQRSLYKWGMDKTGDLSPGGKGSF